MLYLTTYINYLFRNLKFIFLAQLILLLYYQDLLSQNNNFSFTELSDNAKVNALGGNNVSSTHTDFLMNPSLIDKKLFSINYLNYLLDINSSSIMYSDSSKFLGNFGLGIKYLSHGKFEGYDLTGNYSGDFYPKEYIISFGKSYSFSKFKIGTNIKYFYSKLYENSKSAFLVDVGTIFKPIKNKQLSIAIVASNIGFMLEENISSPRSSLKFGTSFKPEYMPIRFSFTYIKKEKEADFKNFSMGIEVLLSKYLNIMIGYNHKIEKGFKLNNSNRLNGISYGLELILKRFNLNYSRLILNNIAGTNNISINYNLRRN